MEEEQLRIHVRNRDRWDILSLDIEEQKQQTGLPRFTM